MFKVLNAYAGWSNVNYVLNNVRNPVHTLKIAGPLGLGICSVLYILANISYFTAATKVSGYRITVVGIDDGGLTDWDRALRCYCRCSLLQECVWNDRRACFGFFCRVKACLLAICALTSLYWRSPTFRLPVHSGCVIVIRYLLKSTLMYRTQNVITVVRTIVIN